MTTVNAFAATQKTTFKVFPRRNCTYLLRTWTTSNSGGRPDVSLVGNFASEDSSLPLNRDEFNSSSSSFIRQAGDVGCFKCPVSCAKPYISASWYQNHLSKCPQPSRAINGWTELNYLLITDWLQFSFSSVYLIPFKQLHDKIQTQIRTWMEKD